MAAVSFNAAGGGCGSCATEKSAREFFATLGVDPNFLDPVHDRCYCEDCYWPAPRWPDTIGNEGPTAYVVPRGWFRFGLSFGSEGRAKKHGIFKKWSASFHGVKSKTVLESILDCGQLMKPGDRLLDGTKLRSTKCAGRQDEGFYTSPTVRYAGLKFYAEPQQFESAASGQQMAGSIVLQCRQCPKSFTMQGETMGFNTQWGRGHLAQSCQHVPPGQLEWKSDVSPATIPCGLLSRVGETVILLHPPLPLSGVSIRMERERQQNDSLANG